jgi:uncharacterized SAM-binding protein YcdF (DUF218 family)
MESTFNERLEALVTSSMRFQKLVFRFIGIFILLGALIIAVLLLTQPAETAEDRFARNGIVVFGIIFLVVGVFMYGFGKRLSSQILDVITNRPDDVVWIYHFIARNKGITAHAIHIRTIHNKKYGLNISSGAKAEELLDLLEGHLPKAMIGNTTENKKAYKEIIKNRRR